MIENLHLEPFARRVRRFGREILLAVTLTLAALLFVLVALHNRAPETAAAIDPGAKPASEPF
jgi:hypothetical protein